MDTQLTNALYGGRDWTVPHDKTAEVTFGTLRYADVGNPDGPPVLCIHGTNIADSLITPLRLYEPLFADYRMISFYRPGYNGSTLNKQGLSVEEGAATARDLLDHLKIDTANVVAFSFGGVLAFQMLLDCPERVTTATLIEPYLPREAQKGLVANIDAFTRALGVYAIGQKVEAARLYMELVGGPNFMSALEMTNPLDLWDRIAQSVDTAFQVDFPAVNAWGFKISEADRFATTKPTMPVLAMMGLDSEAVLPGFMETQRFLMTWLPQAERAGIPGATHGMQSMNPLAVGEATYRFLNKHNGK